MHPIFSDDDANHAWKIVLIVIGVLSFCACPCCLPCMRRGCKEPLNLAVIEDKPKEKPKERRYFAHLH